VSKRAANFDQGEIFVKLTAILKTHLGSQCTGSHFLRMVE